MKRILCTTLLALSCEAPGDGLGDAPGAPCELDDYPCPELPEDPPVLECTIDGAPARCHLTDFCTEDGTWEWRCDPE